jgi:hypothetical protein
MKCDACKYANWARTANGRLHPSKQGKCTFKKNVPVPASMSTFGSNINPDGKILIEGGWIERGDELRRDCAYYTIERKLP